MSRLPWLRAKRDYAFAHALCAKANAELHAVVICIKQMTACMIAQSVPNAILLGFCAFLERKQRMKRLIVAITGASGVIYGIRALEVLRPIDGIETHLILSPSAARTIAEETDLTIDAVRALGDHVYNYKDVGAAISSGSFRTEGMLIAPCSVKTLSGIANAFDDELIVRAADVCLKERRRVVLMFRETPLHAGHIALMDQATRNGAIVMPPVPAFYHQPKTVADIVTQSVGRALDLFGIDARIVKRWKDTQGVAADASRKRAAKRRARGPRADAE
jgi:4-hydroxy-3-polyprenylbenzoate decarboxylase